MKISEWRGYKPQLVSIVGLSDRPGARVLSLYSPSGWATYCDVQGKFTLRDVLWYAGASYSLVITEDEVTARVIRIEAPASYPASGFWDIGSLPIEGGEEIEFNKISGDTSCSFENFDLQNRDFYRRIYDEITAGLKSDEEKVDAVNRYVSERLNYQETRWDIDSPRRILEHGSQYCGHLGNTMATILAAIYPTRIIHMMDDSRPVNTHVVVEVFYEKAWHLYDPTFGVNFKDRQGRVVSHRELQLNSGLVSGEIFFNYTRKYPGISINSLLKIYTSGHHHYYYLSFDSKQYAHAWWAYKAGLPYVSRGDSILLAAAGIRQGSNVTYHIKRAGKPEEAWTFSSLSGATSRNVLNQEESPAVHQAPGIYDVYVDLHDGNIVDGGIESPAFIKDRKLSVKLEVR
jgi:transglutaminase-like putative cysteine protease